MKKNRIFILSLAIVLVIFSATFITAQEASNEASLQEDVATAEAQIEEIATEESDFSTEIQEITGEVLSAEEILNDGKTTEIVLTEDPPHSCEFEDFSKKTKRNEEITFSFYTKSVQTASVIEKNLYLGELPEGIDGSIHAAASKAGGKYDVRISIPAGSQKGSFNLVAFYEETDNDAETKTTSCQFNLVVE